MKNLTLVIPAKSEEYSLPKVLHEIKNINCKKLIVLSKSDLSTIPLIKNFKCKIIIQKNTGYGNALKDGINNVATDYLCIFNADGSFDPKYLRIMIKKVKLNNPVTSEQIREKNMEESYGIGLKIMKNMQIYYYNLENFHI